MHDDQDLARARAQRRETMITGILVSVLVIFAVATAAMWYGGVFGDSGTADSPSVSETAPAPSGSSGTTGQPTQNPGPAQTNR
jgi:hypothetical protein